MLTKHRRSGGLGELAQGEEMRSGVWRIRTTELLAAIPTIGPPWLAVDPNVAPSGSRPFRREDGASADGRGEKFKAGG